jgi:hypothetical protein
MRWGRFRLGSGRLDWESGGPSWADYVK